MREGKLLTSESPSTYYGIFYYERATVSRIRSHRKWIILTFFCCWGVTHKGDKEERRRVGFGMNINCKLTTLSLCMKRVRRLYTLGS